MEDKVRRSIMIALIALLALVVAAPIVYAQSQPEKPNPNAPKDASGTISPDVVAQYPGHCDFPLRLDLSGKGKMIELPDGGVILTSPGLNVTLTNEADDKQATFNITGASHTTTLENGNIETVITGRNFAIDPVVGTVITIGRFTFVFDEAGNLVQSQEGVGQRIDVCALLC
jgi:hypothetical protein